MKSAALKLISFYKKFISPIVAVNSGPRSRCKFYPTCSQYAHEAVRTRGILSGGYLTAKRIIKCSPLTKGGVDLIN